MSIVLGSLGIIATIVILWLDVTMTPNPSPFPIMAVGFGLSAALIGSHWIGW